jgi:hypothetical protein
MVGGQRAHHDRHAFEGFGIWLHEKRGGTARTGKRRLKTGKRDQGAGGRSAKKSDYLENVQCTKYNAQ